MGRETRLKVVLVRKRGLCRLQTRSHSASLAAVLSVRPRSGGYWQATTATARPGAKDRRLLKVCIRRGIPLPNLLEVFEEFRF